jgi:hypothetical protein
VKDTSRTHYRVRRMSDLPELDPNWMRTRQRPQKDESFLGLILVTTGVLAALAWVGRTYAESDHARRAAAENSTALAAAAHERLMDRLEDERHPLHYISEAEADRQLAEASGSSTADKSMHKCFYGAGPYVQAGPCNSRWLDAPQQSNYSRAQNAAEQARERAQAEAKLQAQEARFARLTGQPTWVQPGYSANPQPSERQRCEWAKAERDQAYRLVGNDRTYDFIRHWDDVVYEACKNT